MLTIFCGEDSSAARNEFLSVINSYKKNDAEIVSISPSTIVDVYKGIAENLSLFSSQKVFCLEGLEKHSFKKSTKNRKDDIFEAIVALSSDKNVIILDFEDGKQARQLKLKDYAKVYESKPATSIFQLMDECFPGNKQKFIQALQTVCKTQDEMFTFIMLIRHVRLLVLVSQGVQSTKIPPWQKYKIMGQAGKWDKNLLLNFYSGLIKIEINTKTSNDPYGVAKSLEILACHYL